ncbi:hypothetical protein FNF28_01212 [Cafeteria roenbergensis]|uniref:RING-type domain-containing protein n=1 Tax=Cafeteria roenbergensis TaxID=33653 RepID=A0A5A8E1V5_CAFRO|nr:hypothetical protein FNF28_01212 [Cafeteria roenbergensis]
MASTAAPGSAGAAPAGEQEHPEGVAICGPSLSKGAFYPEDGCCPVCFNDLTDTNALQFACGHVQCAACTLQLFAQSELDSCPQCSATCSRERAKAMFLAADQAAEGMVHSLFDGQSAAAVVSALPDLTGAAAKYLSNDGGPALERADSNDHPVATAVGGATAAVMPDLLDAPPDVNFSGDTGLADALSMLDSPDAATRMNAVFHVRKALSVEESPPLQEVVESGRLPLLVSMAQGSGPVRLQFEALWAITNVASGSSEFTNAAVEAGAIEAAVAAAGSSEFNEVREQAMWCIGNIAGDCARLRDACLSQGAAEAMARGMSSESASIAMTRNGVWAASNLVRGKPKPSLSSIAPLLPCLARCLLSDDAEVLADASWGFSYISDGPNDGIEAVIECGVVHRMVGLLESGLPSLTVPVIRTLGNISSGDESQTQEVIDAGGLDAMVPLLDSPKRAIVKETCWTVSNIAAGSPSQVDSVISSGFMQAVISKIEEGSFDGDSTREAMWVVSNATAGGSPSAAQSMVGMGAAMALCRGLEMSDPRIQQVALEGLSNLAQSDALTPEDLAETGAIDAVAELQSSPNSSVAAAASAFCEQFATSDD